MVSHEENLTDLFTFFNSTSSWIRQNYMQFESMIDIYKGSYGYWELTVSKNVTFDFSYQQGSWISDFFEVLTEMRDWNYSNPGQQVHPTPEWTYRLVGSECLLLPNSSEFAELMTMRERLLELVGALDKPISESMSEYLTSRAKPFTPKSKAVYKIPFDGPPLSESIDLWIEKQLSPDVEKILNKIDTRLETIVGKKR